MAEFDYYITPAPESTQINLNDLPGLVFLMSDTGRGMPPIEYITERGPMQHGETVLDYRLRPRLITMVMRRQYCTRQDFWDGRYALVDYLRSNRQAIGRFNPGQLRKVYPDGTTRDIDVFVGSGPAFSSGKREDWEAFTEVVRFVAHDPTFYDPVAESIEWEAELEDIEVALIFPMVFPIHFMGGMILVSEDITYAGNWLAYPSFAVTGPAANVLIENQTTDEKLNLSGYTIDPLEVVTFVTAYGRKSVTNQLGTNLLPYLSADSDLATFHLEPPPGAAGGVNQMRIYCSGASLNTRINISWNTRFIGI